MRTTAFGKERGRKKKKKKLPMASFDRINQPAYSFWGEQWFCWL